MVPEPRQGFLVGLARERVRRVDQRESPMVLRRGAGPARRSVVARGARAVLSLARAVVVLVGVVVAWCLLPLIRIDRAAARLVVGAGARVAGRGTPAAPDPAPTAQFPAIGEATADPVVTAEPVVGIDTATQPVPIDPPACRPVRTGTVPSSAAPQAGSEAGSGGRPRAPLPVFETMHSALDAVTKNRLRSVLTMIGIIIGVAAVIGLVAMGNGMRANFDAQFSKLANQITITSTNEGGPKFGQGREVTDRDVTALTNSRNAPDVVAVSPSVAKNVILTVGPVQARSKLLGVQHDYLDLMDRKVIAGRWFTPSEITKKDRSVVLGADPVALLWGPDATPEQVLGSTVRVNTIDFIVIGVLKSDGQNDNAAVTSFGGAGSYVIGDNNGRVDQIVVKASSPAAIGRASAQIAEVMDETHHVRSVAKRDYNVLTYTNLLEKSAKFIKTLTLFIVALAAISLLVGGVGVANIMLVSVTERTREIGIRKAIGAKNRAVLRQFLSEAVLLTGLGGIVGMGLGIGATLASNWWLPPAGSPAATETDFPAPILTAQPVIAAFLISLIIGVLAGVYPAARAARMRPIDALRFE